MLFNRRCYKRMAIALMIVLLLSVLLIAMPGKDSEMTSRGEAFFLDTSSKRGGITDENSAENAVMGHKSSLGGAVDIAFDRRIPTAFGEVYIFNQQYKGLPVFGRTLKAGVDKLGKMQFISGNYLKNLECANQSVLTAEQAKAYADECGAEEILSCEPIVYAPSGVGLYAYSVVTNLSGGTRIIIDAENGELLLNVSLTVEEMAEVQAVDAKGVTRTLTADKTNNGYILYDSNRKIQIYDAKSQYEFVGEAITSKDGAFSSDPAAVSLSYALALSYDFYANENNIGVSYLGVDNSHNPNAPDYNANDELVTHAFLHYGYEYQNAAYVTGVQGYTDRDAVFIFGDGQRGGLFCPAAAADVVGHEYQHAVTDYAAGLIYQNQSGAISEAVSDLFGALIEGYSLDNPNFWLCAEDADESGKGGLRDMSNPARLGHPDKISNRKAYCYSTHNHANYSCDNGGVHSNSNILTHAMYLAYQDSLNSGKAMTKENLGKLLFATLSMLPPDVSFDAFAMYTNKAVKMIGLSSADADALWQNLAAGYNLVGIATEYENQVTVTFSGGYSMPPAAVISGKFNDTFIVPTVENPPEGKELAYWSEKNYESKEYARYYPGKEMRLPSKDMTLYPIYIDSIWNGVTPTVLAGSGEFYDPYLIKSAEDLATVAYYSNAKDLIESKQSFSGAYLKITEDIDLKNIPWIPIGTSQVNCANLYVDGGGHNISNLLVNGYGNYSGLFGIMSGSISNLNIKSGLIKETGGDVGGLVGSLWGGEIENCTNAADVILTGDKLNPIYGAVGGIVGSIVFYNGTEVSVKNCINTGNIRGAYAGGIVGEILSAWTNYSKDYYSHTFKLIANCINTGTIQGYIAGGIGGKTTHASYMNCMNFGDISIVDDNKYSGKCAVGGIVGMVNSEEPDNANYKYRVSRVAGAKHAGTVTAESGYAGAIIGYADCSIMTTRLYMEKNFYEGSVVAIGNIDELSFKEQDRIVGKIATSNAQLNFSAAAYYSDMEFWTVENGLGIFDLLYDFTLENGKLRLKAEEEREYWIDNENRAASFSGGDGSQADPYQIATAGELALLAYMTNNEIDMHFATHYRLTANIDLSGKLWRGIGVDKTKMKTFGVVVGYGNTFSGIFDGQGYEIRGMHSVAETFIYPANSSDPEDILMYDYHYAGLFSSLGEDAHIRNVKLSEVYSISNNYAGGLVAHIGSGNYVLQGLIENCSVDGNVSSSRIAGGIVGFAEMWSDGMDIIGCYNGAEVSSQIAGGIIGANSESTYYTGIANIEACVNGGRISNILSHDEYGRSAVGGIVGRLDYINVLSSVNIGKIENYDIFGFSGGIAGQLSNTNNCKSAVIEYCQSIGEIVYAENSPYAECGGILGGVYEISYYDAAIAKVSNCAATQNIYGNGETTKLRVAEANCSVRDIEAFTFTHEYFLNADNFNCAELGAARLYMMLYRSDTDSLILVIGNKGEMLLFESVPKDSDLAEQRKKLSAGLAHEDPSLWYDFKELRGYADMSENRILYAYYALADRYVTIKFLGLNDDLILERYVKYGSSITAPTYPNDKKIIKTENDVYIFEDWETKKFTANDNMTINAVYVRADRYYTVKFMGYDGEVLSIQTVEYSDMPDYPDLVSFETDSEFYIFRNWDKSVTSVTSNETITAEFDIIKKTFTVNYIFANHIIHTETVFYGGKVEQPIVSQKVRWDEQNKYTFKEWGGASDFVTESLDIHAVVETVPLQTFTVTYLNAQGAVYDIAKVKEFGLVPELEVPESEIIDGSRYFYTKWDYPAIIVSEDITVKPVYEILTLDIPIKVIILDEKGLIIYDGNTAGAGLFEQPKPTFEGLKEKYFAGYETTYNIETGTEIRTQVFKWRLTAGAYVVIAIGGVCIATVFGVITLYILKRYKSKTKI